MPQLTEANAVGNREDLRDWLVFANPGDTPFTSGAMKISKPGNKLIEYVIDKHPTPNTDGVLDGQDVQSYENVQENRALLYSRVQRWRKAPMVSHDQQRVAIQAGTKDPMAQAIVTSLTRLKQDMEYTFMSDNESQADNGTVPSKTRGLGKWQQATAQTDLPVDSNYLPVSGLIYSGAIGSFVESSLVGIMKTRWQQTKNKANLNLYAGSEVKSRITTFTQYAPDVSSNLQVRRFNQNNGTEIAQSVDVYKGDYGRVFIILEPYMPDEYRGYILDMSMICLAWTDAPYSRPLPDLGGGPRSLVEAEGALLNKNPLSHGKIAGTA